MLRCPGGLPAARFVAEDADKLMPPSPLSTVANKLVAAIAAATAAAANETQLRHELEKALESACDSLGIVWTPFQLDRTLGSGRGTRRFVDVAHGAVVIEYEPPRSFKGQEGAKLQHARAQAEEYASLLAHEEGRPLDAYLLAAWDGASITFGRFPEEAPPRWDSLVPFDDLAAGRLLEALQLDGIPIVHPRLLAQLAGPESECGAALIPLLFDAVSAAQLSPSANKTRLLFSEWRRLFGQAVGVQTAALRRLLAEQGSAHGKAYDTDPASYLFALHTYIALLAKLVAACALPNAGEDILDRDVAIGARISALESGSLFEHAGISNMLNGDFFSWYHDHPSWPALAPVIERLVATLAGVDFDVTRKSAASTRDLFKGIYESFVPRALRHALGEFYTPDWLAEHALNVVGWSVSDSLLDPTCGSGTFVLEALRRRLGNESERDPRKLLHGLHGFDLNPLAVLSAKGSLAVYIAPYLDPSTPVRLPIYLADAINPASLEADGSFAHVLQTELGPRTFRLTPALIDRPDFFSIFARLRELVDANVMAVDVVACLEREFPSLRFDAFDRSTLCSTVEVLRELHSRGWNGIWCPIVADRFAAGAIRPVAYICGNPPWVKWSHLPPEYAAFIAPRCRELGVFSSDRWVGGIESDISTVITFEVIGRFLSEGGKLAFLITGTVFANESSEGFRQFRLLDGQITCRVLEVEDFDALRPFDGVSNRPTLLTVQSGGATAFPVPYRVWTMRGTDRSRPGFKDAAAFLSAARCEMLRAGPVPGGNGARPWLIGSDADHAIFAKVFSAGAGRYVARKGVTTDRNGIFWVIPTAHLQDGKVRVRNAPEIGRSRGIAQRRGSIEVEHLFPLLRGRGVKPFCAVVDPELRIIVPQRGMYGDPALPTQAPETYRFLRGFKAELEQRSSFRRFQAGAGHPFYSLWSIGAYTFSPYKVLWREMGGGSFAAAYIGRVDDPILGRKLVIPDHKLYFIPVKTEDEAAYLAGLLNAPLLSHAVAAFASQLSLGASVAEYLHLPPYDKADVLHRSLGRIALTITRRGTGPQSEDLQRLDELAHALFDRR